MLNLVKKTWLITFGTFGTFGAFVLRFYLLGDMEFKGDERAITDLIAHLFEHPYSPLAPVSAHSGIAHSSGFFYFLAVVSLGASTPLALASAVAFFNAFSIALPAFIVKNFRVTFLLWATSVTLIFASRKIWNPDLVAPWICLGMGFFLYARQQGKMRIYLLSAFCFPIAGHMYLAGGVFAATVSGVVTISLFAQRQKRELRNWLLGSALGWATFIPYGISLITDSEHAFSGGSVRVPFTLVSLLRGVRTGLTLPTNYPAYRLYLDPIFQMIPHKLFALCLLCFSGLSLLWILSLFQAWIHRQEVLRDPLLMCLFTLMGAIPLALALTGLGDWLNYWFALLPFQLHLMGWATERSGKGYQYLAYSSVVLSVLTFFSLANWIHANGGLPGEYGPAFLR